MKQIKSVNWKQSWLEQAFFNYLKCKPCDDWRKERRTSEEGVNSNESQTVRLFKTNEISCQVNSRTSSTIVCFVCLCFLLFAFYTGMSLKLPRLAQHQRRTAELLDLHIEAQCVLFEFNFKKSGDRKTIKQTNVEWRRKIKVGWKQLASHFQSARYLWLAVDLNRDTGEEGVKMKKKRLGPNSVCEQSNKLICFGRTFSFSDSIHFFAVHVGRVSFKNQRNSSVQKEGKAF